MVKIRTMVLAAVLGIVQISAASAAAPPAGAAAAAATMPAETEAPGPSAVMQDLETFADGAIAESMHDLDPTATLLSVVRGDEQFAKAYGIADIEKGRRADDSTLFGIGSISKTFTWLAVMILVEEGKLDLDADVNTYLKAFQIPAAFDSPVTMNHLLAHRSGFEESDPWFFTAHRDIPLAEALAQTIPVRVAPPGERTAYTNWGSALAALIVENVGGQPYDAFVQQRILDPLGMVSTTLHDPASIMPKPLNPATLDARMATAYRMKKGLPEAQRYLGFEPAYAMGSAALNARDAATYMRALLNGTQYPGGRLVSQQTWDAFQERVFNDREGADDFVGGFRHQKIAGYHAIGHQGGSSFTATMKLIPELGMGVFLAVNSRSGWSDGRALSRMLVLRAEGKSFDALSLPTPVEGKGAKELAGKYSANRRTFSRAERFADIGLDVIITPNRDGSIVMSSGSQKSRFVPLGNDIWMDTHGERIKAYRDREGRVYRVSGGAIQTMDRIGPLQASSTFYLLFGITVLLSITTLLGAWWRWGRRSATGRWGPRLRWLPPLVASVWLVLAASVVWLTMVIADFEPVRIQSGEALYPPLAATVVLTLSMVVAALAVVQLIALVPVWRASGWSFWRRMHFTLYTAVIVLTVGVMWSWNMIGKPLTTVI